MKIHKENYYYTLYITQYRRVGVTVNHTKEGRFIDSFGKTCQENNKLHSIKYLIR